MISLIYRIHFVVFDEFEFRYHIVHVLHRHDLIVDLTFGIPPKKKKFLSFNKTMSSNLQLISLNEVVLVPYLLLFDDIFHIHVKDDKS
jgi:hypothetical protein